MTDMTMPLVAMGPFPLNGFVRAAIAQAPGKFWWMIGGVIGLLMLASAIGWVLGKRKPSAVVDNLNARINAGG